MKALAADKLWSQTPSAAADTLLMLADILIERKEPMPSQGPTPAGSSRAAHPSATTGNAESMGR